MAALTDDSSTSAVAEPPRRNQNAASSSSVQVAVRVRPMLPSEAGSTQCIEVLRGTDSNEPNVARIGGESGPTFAFDEAFDGSVSQGHMYRRRVAPLVKSCMEGYNATVLAYGQTGSGKTHSIMGPSTSMAMHDDTTAGVIPRALRDLFGQLEQVRQQSSKACCNKENNQPQNDSGDDASYEYEVRVQFLELYGEEIRDLMTPSSSERLTIRDVGLAEPEVMGATRHKVDSAEEALLCLARGQMRRVTGATAMNASSSRSHAILSVLVEQTTTTVEEPSSTNQEPSQQVQHVQVKRSKFNFVDLAGSERQKRTQAEGQRLKEGIDINKGLLVLGNVISALGDPRKAGKSFVPYRDSKLTRLLKGSLGGNHKTLMIACVSPSSNNLEESLNCLRYANRAKNIQNNAVVNIDAGSRLVAELRQQVQALATDLLRAKEGDLADGCFTIDTLQSLAAGSDPTGSLPATSRSDGGPAAGFTPRLADQCTQERIQQVEKELTSTQEQLRLSKAELSTTAEALHVTRAEKELYRLQFAATSDDAPNMDIHAIFLERAAAYEKEIASLKDSVRKASIAHELGTVEGSVSPSQEPEENLSAVAKAHQTLTKDKVQFSIIKEELSSPRSPSGNNTDIDALESPDFVRLRSKVLESISHADQLEAEEEAETTEITTITSKYLANNLDDEEHCNDVDPEEKVALERELDQSAIEGSLRHQQQMEAHLLEISRSIEAKEDLINQLQVSQEKYAAMRKFYEDKLNQMEEQVRKREYEREQLAQELKKLEESNSCTKDLQARLTDKETHIAGLRKKQRELITLTKVSSKNESEIDRLRHEVVNMKQKKVDLQKMITSERKNHALEIQKLKKEAMQRDREATKWKRISDKKAVEAEKANQIAKARLEQVGQLRSKYKEAERKLRVKTVKRGVMEKAGLDAVIVGRRDSKARIISSAGAQKRKQVASLDFDGVRDFLDQKVAEVGRKEAIADKLANEWEDHLELVSQREELVRKPENHDCIDAPTDAVNALDVQIQYKEERIRQLSRRLGKAQTDKGAAADSMDVSFLEDRGFKSVLGDKSPLIAVTVAARVLFGMVVRERRRVASLARTASSLDAKALEIESATAEKDAAFRAYMEEERRERESLAQSQQEQILSLMAMVQEGDGELVLFGANEEGAADNSFQASRVLQFEDKSLNPRALILANERISALQRQLHELQAERELKESYKAQEAEARSLLASASGECQDLQKQLNSLRSSLRQIRETVSRQNDAIADEDDEDGSPRSFDLVSGHNELRKRILGIVMEALHPSRSIQSGSRQSRTPSTAENNLSRRPKVFSPRLKRHVELMHTSDSEEDGEVPEWAGDIMADLALIAEGEVPPSLRDADVVQPGKNDKSTHESVFDRLTHPDNFTGVQKQKTTRQRRIKSAPVQNNTATRGGQDGRSVLSRSVSETLEKLVIPDGKSQVEPIELPQTEFHSSSEQASSEVTAEQREAIKKTPAVKVSDHRSVFDRLVSPSNYTGTQKERIHSIGQKANQDTWDEPDEVLDELLASDVEEDEASTAEHIRGSKVFDYTQQDVFERLQRTTTQSYAVKHGNNPSTRSPTTSPVQHTNQVGHSELSEAPETVANAPTLETNTDHSEYFRQNVFERLQKTTTQAYAKKTNRASSTSGSTQGKNFN